MAVSPAMGFPRTPEERNKEGKLLASSFKAANRETQQKQTRKQVRQQQFHRFQELLQQFQFPFGMTMQPSSSSFAPAKFMNKDAGGYVMGEVDQPFFPYLDGQDPSKFQDQRRNISLAFPSNVQEPIHQGSGMRPETLDIFPAEPMHVGPVAKANTGLVSPGDSGLKRPRESPKELSNPHHVGPEKPQRASGITKREGNRRASYSSHGKNAANEPDEKTLKRLAQNREAARKSRLRKKAYVQQLEASTLRLIQLEQELQRARAQGMVQGARVGGELGRLLPDGRPITVFDMKYAQWVEAHNRKVAVLRSAMEGRVPDAELRVALSDCVAHYDEMINLKGNLAKSEPLYILSGMWKAPVERIFMWVGGFRPSDLIKIIANNLEPTYVTEHQILGVCELQRTTYEAEEAIYRGLEALLGSLAELMLSEGFNCPPNSVNYLSQMAIALSKLDAVEAYIKQGDQMRIETLRYLHQLFTTRQGTQCFLAIEDFFNRLRALSSVWMARPRQNQG